MLKPPVGNKLVYEDPEIIVMMVGGPNARKDFHFHERGPEFFVQIEGDIVLKVMEESGKKDVVIKEGEMFLMPGGTIHSPQRPPNTVGLVIELKAKQGELDYLHYYCEKCNNMLHRISFELNNIVTELPPIMDKFFASEDYKTCKQCNTVMEKPELLTSLEDAMKNR
ncbi:MAG: 3-hydroxyanthranilate 3,4-dioxygenase [Candidatus Heimdallarchaeota archaeon LC_3]|nr:MAG: 3-hydroxyanthranilate 3,4-dioxygenase [Candidatus Heimdallarchaeota archaeon LC_3]